MHLTLKKETTKPAAANLLQQQARFDTSIARYNRERPHQALDMNMPADLYTRSHECSGCVAVTRLAAIAS